MLPAIEIETDSNPTSALIWLHGLGADGNDFVPIINELEVASKASIRFIFPHAPERPVSINSGYRMRAWYDIYHPDFTNYQDEGGIRDSKNAIDALIEKQLQLGITAQHIVLAGFSQGGAMALHVGLHQVNRLGGIMALSCYLPFAEILSSKATVVNASIPIFMAHGTYDKVIPLSFAIASKEKLMAAHFSVEWHEYLIAHTVSQQEIIDINHWLQRIMSFKT